LDTPVVPPVYCRKAMSSCPTATGLSALPHHEIDDQALQPEHVAERSHHHVLHRRARQHLFQRVREVLQDDDHFGAGVLQLVLQFPGRVERIDVHHDAARAQGAVERNRILQAVGHHERHPHALAIALRLQPGAESARQAIEVREADGLAHAVESRAGTEFHDLLVHQVAHRLVLLVVDVGRHARGIALQPDAFHGSSSLDGMILARWPE
jgi:hypothetical protein